MTAKELEISVIKAIRLLRKKKLERGLPFMINTDFLESNQCYMEFPDGSIKIVEADPKGYDFRIVLEFGTKESDDLRRKFKLI